MAEPFAIQEALNSAISFHHAGDLKSAARLYQQVLEWERDNDDALHMFGVLNHQLCDHNRAVELISRAVAIRPNIPLYHANLAEVYRAQGKFERSAGCSRMALRLQPDYPEAWSNLGLALAGLGKHEEAVEQFRSALQHRPDFSSAHSNLGISLRELGRFEEALICFQRAVDLAPEDARAQANLGQMLVDHGRAVEALPPGREAVRLQPDCAALQHNLGNILRVLGEWVEARAAYLEALRLEPGLAKSHAHLALVLQQEGQYDEAVVWLKQAVELEPDNAEFWENLAELQGEREEPVEARLCWQRIVDLAPNRAEAHNGLGWSMQDTGQPKEAGEHFRFAIQLQPNLATAHMNLGGLHEELGELTEAEAEFRKAIQIQPSFAMPHARLATLLRDKLPESDRIALEQRLADSQLGPGPRARLLFGLAQVADARGDYVRAAECLTQANALSLELTRQQKRDYHPEEHENFIGALLRTFDRDFFARLAGGGLPTSRPVFIFGLPRSGTTLIEQMLASHSCIRGAGELRLARQSFESLPGVLGLKEIPLACVARLDKHSLEKLALQHEQKLSKFAASPSDLIVDKMPDNYMYIGLLVAMFPRAIFIHCRRDLRDVAVSCWMTDFRSIRWANSVEHIASRFQQYQRIMTHWHSVFPGTIHEVVYEQAVVDLEGVSRRLIAACGLEWEPACLEFHRTRRSIRTASVGQVRQPLYQRSVKRWRNYEKELAHLFAILPVR